VRKVVHGKDERLGETPVALFVLEAYRFTSRDLPVGIRRVTSLSIGCVKLPLVFQHVEPFGAGPGIDDSNLLALLEKTVQPHVGLHRDHVVVDQYPPGRRARIRTEDNIRK